MTAILKLVTVVTILFICPRLVNAENCTVYMASTKKQTVKLVLDHPEENGVPSTVCILLTASRPSDVVVLEDERHYLSPRGGPLCRYNYIQVRDGNSIDSPLLYQWCDTPLYYRHFMASTGQEMLLLAKVTYSLYTISVKPEVRFNYFSHPKGEVIILDKIHYGSTFFSPGFPDNYLPNIHAGWQMLSSYDENVVGLSIIDFVLEDSPNCTKDYLELRDGPDPSSPLLHKLCGNVKIPYVEATGKVMFLIFRTDAVNQFRGFKVKGGVRRIVKPTTPPPSTGDMDDNYGENIWYLIVAIIAGIVLVSMLYSIYVRLKKIISSRSHHEQSATPAIPLHTLS